MKKISCILLLIVAINTYAASCLDKLLPDFKDYNITVETTKNHSETAYTISGSNGAKCKATHLELEKFINKNFIKISKTNPGVIQSWNYLALNKKVIYDYLKDELPDLGSGETSSTEYKLVSIINNKIACFTTAYDYEGGGAHPYSGTDHICSTAESAFIITDFASEKEIVAGMLKVKQVSDIFKKYKVKPDSITTFDKFYEVISKDDDVNCGLEDGRIPLSGFTVDKLNADGTINISYDPSTLARFQCMAAALDVIELKNLHSKIKITKFVLPNQL